MTWQFFFLHIMDAAWVAEVLLEALTWVLLCRGVSLKRENILYSLAELAVLTAVFAVGNALLMVYMGDMSRVTWALLRGVIAFLYLNTQAPYGRQTGFVLWAALFGTECALIALGGQLSYLTGAFIVKGTLEGVVRVTFNLLGIPAALMLRRMNFDEFGAIPKSGMYMLLAGDVGILLLHIVEVQWFLNGVEIVTTLAIAYLCMVCMELMAGNAMYHMCREQTAILTLQAEQQRLLSEKETMLAAQTRIDELRSIRHDLKNQYAYMQILLEEGRYEELGSYFRQVSEAMPKPLNYVDCGNNVINSILNMEINKAKRGNIPVVHQLVVPPVLPFTEGDLCAILVNLLDNSIEECRRLRDTTGGEPEIRLEIYPQRSYLLIVCSNPTNREKLERSPHGIRTTKGDDNLHGFGTRIISKTAERNNGCADFRLENGRFISKVMLDLMEGEHHAD